MMQAASSLPTLSAEEERARDFGLVSLINVDANLFSKEVVCVPHHKCFISWFMHLQDLYSVADYFFYFVESQLSLNTFCRS